MNRFSIQEPVKKPRSIPWTALISIVVLGALVAAVLIPSYGDYADRAQVAEAMSLLSGAKAPLADYYGSHKKWPPSLADERSALHRTKTALYMLDYAKKWPGLSL